jgi:ribA/ribD-fused uncharacterized protein
LRITDKFVFFWKTEDFLSQWHPASFFDERGIVYNCAEQYMMRKKALRFGDVEAAELILELQSPKRQKEAGKSVKGFDSEKWDTVSLSVVIEGNLLKFTQNDVLKKMLLDTRDLILVEASPYDRIWGIGLSANHPDSTIPSKWKGQNKLGEALMEVRKRIREE